MRDFKAIGFWEDAHQLAIEIYNLTKTFPKSEVYGITSQLRRASLSVPTNIAEGCGRESINELKRYMVVSNGSITEVQYLLMFCYDIDLIQKKRYEALNEKVISIKKRLTVYLKKL
ncbi:MAG: four helix bundle protein [Bacteroidetes bacterium]|nr:four helix bundle protein [Bacteroidota bacterium]